MSEPRDPDCRADKHRACSGVALDEVSDTFVPCGCPCHGEHEHEWQGSAAQRAVRCRLCGVERRQHQCREVDATTYADAERVYVCTEPGHEGPTERRESR